MKKNGLFQIIQSIKSAYGPDVTTISCEELNKGHESNYKNLVKHYMLSKFNNISIFKNSCEMSFLKKIIYQKFGPKKSESIYNEIVKKVKTVKKLHFVNKKWFFNLRN